MWNYKIGKKPGPEEGLLHCKACGKNWKWKDRASNLSRTICSKARLLPARAVILNQLWQQKNPSQNLLDLDSMENKLHESADDSTLAEFPIFQQSDASSSSARCARFPTGIG